MNRTHCLLSILFCFQMVFAQNPVETRMLVDLQTTSSRVTASERADLDGDGLPDLVLATNGAGTSELRLYHGRDARIHEETALYQRGAVLELPAAASQLASGDYNRDGRMDLLALSEDGRLFLYQGKGEGLFEKARHLPMEGPISHMISGPLFRNDGRSDLVLAQRAADGPELLWFDIRKGDLDQARHLPLDATVDQLSLVAGAEPQIALVQGRRLTLYSSREGEAPQSWNLPDGVGALTNFRLATGEQPVYLSRRGEVHVLDRELDGLAPRRLAGISHGKVALLENARLLRVPGNQRDGDGLLAVAEKGSEILRSTRFDEALLGLGSPLLALHAQRIDGSRPEHLLVVTEAGVLLMTAKTGTTFTVDTTADTADSDTGDDLCADANGDCSLRAAIQQANATSGADTIAFALSTSDPGYNATTGIYTIAPATALPAISEAVSLDGSTQSGYGTTPIIELDGSGAGVGTDGLVLSAGDSLVRGLAIHSFDRDGVLVDTLGGNLIEACHLGTDGAGSGSPGNGRHGIRITSANNTVGGSVAGSGNLISANGASAVVIDGTGTTGNQVLGNRIGTDLAGTSALGNGDPNAVDPDSERSVHLLGGASEATVANNLIAAGIGHGIYIDGGSDHLIQGNQIGGSGLGNGLDGIVIEASADNTVSGNTVQYCGNSGIVLYGSGTSGNSIQGNLLSDQTAFGIDVHDTADGPEIGGNTISDNGTGGILIDNADATLVGGSAGANQLTDNLGPGISVSGSTSTGNSILGNVISDNSGLGIDLGAAGVDSNDTDDVDSGPNTLLNFPVLTSVDTAWETVVNGTYQGAANATYHVEVYADHTCDSSGNGEGRFLLGSGDITTDANGDASFSLSFEISIQPGMAISATATAADGNTSEYSACVSAAGDPGGYYWIATTSGNWNTAANWSTGSVPGLGDRAYVVINEPVAVAMDVNTELATFVIGGLTDSQSLTIDGLRATITTGARVQSRGIVNLESGWQDGDGYITVNGVLNWSGGGLDDHGTRRINGLLNITGSTTKQFHDGTLEVAGTAIISGGGDLDLYYKPTITNLAGGLFDIQTGITFDNRNTTPDFNNNGLLRIGGNVVLETELHNNGTLDLHSGTLNMWAGGSASGGQYLVGSGTNLVFNGGTFDLDAASSITGAGDVTYKSITTIAGYYNITGGTYMIATSATFTGTIDNFGEELILSGGHFAIDTPTAHTIPTSTTLELKGGRLEGSADLILETPLLWSSGWLNGPGLTIINDMYVTGGGIKYINRRTLDVQGTATITGSGRWQLYPNAVINNLPGAVFDFQTGVELFWNSGSTPIFDNQGTVRIAGTVEFGASLDNHGLVEINSGRLEMKAGGVSDTGEFTVAAGRTLCFYSGTFDLGPNTSITGLGRVENMGNTTIGGTYDIAEKTWARSGFLYFTKAPLDLGAELRIDGNFSADAPEGITIPTGTYMLVNAGNLLGSGDLTVETPMIWRGGDFSGKGRLTINDMLVEQSYNRYVSNKDVDIFGTVTVTSSSNWYARNGSVITIHPGAVVDYQASPKFYHQAGALSRIINYGTIVKSGGTNKAKFWLTFENHGHVESQSGSLLFYEGYQQWAGETVMNGGRLETAHSLDPMVITGGHIEGDNRLTGSLEVGAGTEPGGNGTVGVLEVTGNYEQDASGELIVDITSAGGDRLSVGRDASLDGRLEIRLASGYTPAIGTQFEIIGCVSRSGTFDSVAGRNISAGRIFDVTYNSDSVVLTVVAGTNVSEPPRAVDDTAYTGTDLSIAIPVLHNDLSPGGGSLSLVSYSNPSKGTLVQGAGSVLTYTPNAGYKGNDSFTYQISDGTNSDVGTVVISVLPDTVNRPPNAYNDRVDGLASSGLNIDVTANDPDVDGDPLTITATTTPLNGELVVQGSNLLYIPEPEWTGSDSFSYTIDDGNGDSGTAEVFVTITNAVPSTSGVNVSVAEDGSQNIDILSGVSDSDGDTLAIIAVGTASHGSIAPHLDGTVTYTPAPDYYGADSFTVTVADGRGGQVQVPVSVTVAGSDDVPVIAYEPGLYTPLDTAVSLDLEEVVWELDGETLSASLTSDGTHGSVTISGGVATYTPDAAYSGLDSFEVTLSDPLAGSVALTVEVTIAAQGSASLALEVDEDGAVAVDLPAIFLAPNPTRPTTIDLTQGFDGRVSLDASGRLVYVPDAGFSGSDSFEAVLSDGAGRTLDVALDVTVLATNHAPAGLTDYRVSAATDTTLILAPLSNFYDVDSDTLSLSSASAHSGGTVTIGLDHSLSYTPPSGFTGVDTLYTLINDGMGGSALMPISIVVSPTQNLALYELDLAVEEDQTLLVDVLAPLSLSGSPSISTVSAAANGTVVDQGGGIVSYTPDSNFTGGDTLTVTLSDSSQIQLNLAVIPVNDLPTASLASLLSIDEDDPITVAITAAASDVEGAVSLLSVSDGAHGSTSRAGGSVTYTPDAHYHGDDSFVVTVVDADGAHYAHVFEVAIASVPDAPIVAPQSATVAEDGSVDIDVLASAYDPDGDPISITSVGQGSGGTLTVLANQTLRYVPDPDFNGSDSPSCVVSDNTGLDTTVVLAITVQPVNDPPTAQSFAVSTDEDVALHLDVITLASASDVDLDSLGVVSVTQGSLGSVVIETNGTVTYSPYANVSGSDSFDCEISDGNGGSVTITASITIDPVNDPPTGSNFSSTTDEDVAVSIAVTSYASDVEGDNLSVSSVSQPGHGSVVIGSDSQSVTFTPVADFNGSDSFDAVVSDGNGGSVTLTVSITVVPVNDAPTISPISVSTSMDTAVVIDVIASANDVEGDSMSVITLSTPANGTAVIDMAGTVTYTPASSYTGSDSFDVTVSDGQGGQVVGTVSVTVNP